jgi:hypothetical protein
VLDLVNPVRPGRRAATLLQSIIVACNGRPVASEHVALLAARDGLDLAAAKRQARRYAKELTGAQTFRRVQCAGGAESTGEAKATLRQPGLHGRQQALEDDVRQLGLWVAEKPSLQEPQRLGHLSEPQYNQGRFTCSFGVNVPCWSFRGEPTSVNVSPLPSTVQPVSVLARAE